MRADAGDIGEPIVRRDAFAQTIGRAREAPRPESAFIEPVDGGMIRGTLRRKNERQVGHDRFPGAG